ncbi:MAG: hypothetical protein WBG92_01405 [Thiohalocapsa sp.]
MTTQEIAEELTVLLKSSRAVLVQNKTIITDPTNAGIDADTFMEMALANYQDATGEPFAVADGNGNKGEAQQILTDAIKQTVDEVVSGNDTDLDPQGRFLPAIFPAKPRPGLVRPRAARCTSS